MKVESKLMQLCEARNFLFDKDKRESVKGIPSFGKEKTIE